MHGLRNKLVQEQKYLESILIKLEKNRVEAPEGKLRVSVSSGRTRYYHCLNDRLGEYIPKDNIKLVQQLAQKNYNEKVEKIAKIRLNRVKNCLKGYSDDEIDEIYTSLHAAKQELVTPVKPTSLMLEERWIEEEYKTKGFQDGTPVILTERGERVRSKSEKILADYFYRNDIAYKYEKPLILRGVGTVYPDFTFLSKETGKEIYWEHEGMMDKSEYALYAVKKFNSYMLNGIMPGERLILTFETSQEVLNMKIVAELVKRYLR